LKRRSEDKSLIKTVKGRKMASLLRMMAESEGEIGLKNSIA
jgi:hypothetical protein